MHATVAVSPFGYGSVPPVISVGSLEITTTYASSNIPLILNLNRPATWIGYSLDVKANSTITGNTTITGLSSGLFNITIYAKDESENIGASETITCAIVATTLPTIQTTAILAASTIAVVSIGLILYYRKHKCGQAKISLFLFKQIKNINAQKTLIQGGGVIFIACAGHCISHARH
jgi:hypothetical protein